MRQAAEKRRSRQSETVDADRADIVTVERVKVEAERGAVFHGDSFSRIRAAYCTVAGIIDVHVVFYRRKHGVYGHIAVHVAFGDGVIEHAARRAVGGNGVFVGLGDRSVGTDERAVKIGEKNTILHNSSK